MAIPFKSSIVLGQIFAQNDDFRVLSNSKTPVVIDGSSKTLSLGENNRGVGSLSTNWSTVSIGTGFQSTSSLLTLNTSQIAMDFGGSNVLLGTSAKTTLGYAGRVTEIVGSTIKLIGNSYPNITSDYPITMTSNSGITLVGNGKIKINDEIQIIPGSDTSKIRIGTDSNYYYLPVGRPDYDWDNILRCDPDTFECSWERPDANYLYVHNITFYPPNQGNTAGGAVYFQLINQNNTRITSGGTLVQYLYQTSGYFPAGGYVKVGSSNFPVTYLSAYQSSGSASGNSVTLGYIDGTAHKTVSWYGSGSTPTIYNLNMSDTLGLFSL